MTVAVRPAVAADFDAWLPLWRGYQAFYEVDIPAESTALTWRRFLDPAEPMHALVAADDGGPLVGVVHYIFHRSCWTAGDYCYLQDLFVAPERRGAGVGRALIEAVYAAADAAGIARVYWLTHESNVAGRRLYDRIARNSGFIQYRRPA
ncbi:MAG: N-acetyltransferase family protein [Rhodospirillaceae bacterium]